MSLSPTPADRSRRRPERPGGRTARSRRRRTPRARRRSRRGTPRRATAQLPRRRRGHHFEAGADERVGRIDRCERQRLERPGELAPPRQNGSSLSIPGAASSGTVAIVSFTVASAASSRSWSWVWPWCVVVVVAVAMAGSTSVPTRGFGHADVAGGVVARRTSGERRHDENNREQCQRSTVCSIAPPPIPQCAAPPPRPTNTQR